MQEQNAWSKYLDHVSAGDPNSMIAAKVGVDPATVGRWRTGAVDPKPRQVVDVARTYSQNPLAALIAAGYLTPEEVGLPITIPNITVQDFDDVALAEELLARLRRNMADPTSQLPTTTDIGGSESHITFSDTDARTRENNHTK